MKMNKDISWLKEAPIIAHRGYTGGGAPENSLPAFKEAAERGLPIELDVHCLKDGEIAVFHDFDLLRMCGLPLLLFRRKSEDLKKFRLKGTQNTIPLLKDVLKLVDGRVGLLIELKVFVRYKRLCNNLIRTLADYSGPVALQGFSCTALRYLASKCDYPLGIIGMNYKKAGFFGLIGTRLNRMPYFEEINPQFLNYLFRHIPSPASEKCRARNMVILGWTVKTHKDLEDARKVCDVAIADTYIIKDDYKAKEPKEAVALK